MRRSFAQMRTLLFLRPRDASSKSCSDTAKALAGLVWAVTALAAYYGASAGYYAEKLAVFGRFLFGGG